MQKNNLMIRQITSSLEVHNSYVRRPLGIYGMVRLAKKTKPGKINFKRHNCGGGFKGKIITKKKIVIEGYDSTRIIRRNVRFCEFCGREFINGKWVKAGG